ncbi:hypothetical protein V2J09_009547 [Rumex salicifolius]
MAGGKKYTNVVVLSDSDDDAGLGDLRRMELSEEEADELSPSSDDENPSEDSSFHPSGDESEPSDEDSGDDRDYQQSEDDHTDEVAREASCSSDPGRPGDEAGDDDTLCNRVVQMLQEKRDIGHLSLQVYRSYLRKHGLRISGTKAECLMRIHEHWRIKDGRGEALYPRSSFTINCTGDVCKGDVVQFRQRVYQKFDKLTRSGKVLGSRTIAGRVVKESYGAAKQQHTFTVEVLWSKGTNKLPPLFPLLVKGRNLYRLKTFRQPWKNEAERSKALDEKHARGAMARQKRSIRVQGRKTHKSRQSSDKGPIHQKQRSVSNHTRGKYGDQRGKAIANPVIRTVHEKGQRGNKAIANESNGARTFKPASRHKKLNCETGNRASTSVPYPDAPYQQFRGLPMHFDYRNAQFAFHRGNVPSSSSSMGHSAVHHLASQFHHQPPGSYSYTSECPSSAMSFPALNSGIHMHQNQRFFNCSTRGCKNLGSDGCAISGCWQCCRRAGYRCHVHKCH